MPVNLEVKGSLAKCLATENIIVEHKKVPTACFHVDRRILTLPMWDKASATVYDLLVGHEVGHALFTDNIDWTEEYPDVPKDFVNVLEDARVERLMKKKYPGLAKTFFNGYNELNDQDFFSVKNENLNKLSFIDRINLYFKIGAFHNIEFSDQENEFVTRITQLETFKQVLDLAKEIVEFLNYKRKQLSEMPEISQNQGESGEEVDFPDDSEQNTQQDSVENGEDIQDSSIKEKSSNEENINMDQKIPDSDFGKDPGNTHDDEFESRTSQSFDQKSQELNDQFSMETNYVELPEIILENVIIPNSFIHQKAREFYSSGSWINEFFQEISKEYVNYKKSAEKEVSYLVKEFECKKSADQYARSSVARTGVLDTSKLHTYKYNEDLFKKVSVIPDGKNHGLIFILDWSGSMQDWILDTCKQLFNLIWFCRKVNIPFDVYAFSVDCSSYVELNPNHPPIYKQQEDVIVPEKSFRLLNIFTSKTNSKETEEQMKHIWACCYSFQERKGYVPRHLDLSGSPIGDTMLALHSLIPDFQNKNKLQKVNVVFLTDGEGYVNVVTKKKKNTYNGEDYVGFVKPYNTTLRNRKNGRIYSKYQYGNFPQYSKVLLTSLKDNFPMVNFVNFRVVPSKDFNTCYNYYGLETGPYDKIRSLYKKNNFVTFTQTGYDQFNVIPTNTLSQEESFNVDEGASKAQIKASFMRMLDKKKTNKKLLSSFIDIIA